MKDRPPSRWPPWAPWCAPTDGPRGSARRTWPAWSGSRGRPSTTWRADATSRSVRPSCSPCWPCSGAGRPAIRGRPRQRRRRPRRGGPRGRQGPQRLPRKVLVEALASGRVPVGFEPHIAHVVERLRARRTGDGAGRLGECGNAGGRRLEERPEPGRVGRILAQGLAVPRLTAGETTFLRRECQVCLIFR